MNSTPHFSQAASFRDPGGNLFVLPDRVIRAVTPSGTENVSALLRSAAASKLMAEGRIVSSRILQGSEADSALRQVGLSERRADIALVLEHERLRFPSYAYEWSAPMLAAAARCTLDIADSLLTDGIGLKDATPYNVLFRGPQPVFVDVMSLEPRRLDDPLWLPYGQFLRTFLLPLLANKHPGMALDQVFLTRRDGLEPEELYRWSGPVRRLLPPLLGNVSIPTWLSHKAEGKGTALYAERSQNAERCTFILRTLFRRLRKSVARATAEPAQSTWSNYMERTNRYSDQELSTKMRFVSEFVAEFRPKQVLDAGCNTGAFSMIAADAGSEVVAIDLDPEVIGRLWQEASMAKKNVLPLVVNLSRPSPSTGWWNRECPSFLDRAQGAFDAVFMLALIHHLIVTERVPLPEIVRLAAHMTRRFLVIELVARHDPMFLRLTRGRDHLHRDFTQELFEAEFGRAFRLVRKQMITHGDRTLYIWEK